MKIHVAATLATAVGLVAGLLVIATPAQAHNGVRWSVTVNSPGYSGYSPGYYYPPPQGVVVVPQSQYIYGAPPSAFTPPPPVIYVQPQPVYPPPVIYVQPNDGRLHQHRHQHRPDWNNWDRGHRGDWRR